MLQPVFPLFSSGITASMFASAKGGQVSRHFGGREFQSNYAGKVCVDSDTFWVLDSKTQFTLLLLRNWCNIVTHL